MKKKKEENWVKPELTRLKVTNGKFTLKEINYNLADMLSKDEYRRFSISRLENKII